MKSISQINIYPGEGLRGEGKLGLEGVGADTAGEIFNNFISTVIGLMTVIAVIWFTFLLISGGYAYMQAGGDKAAVENAQKRLQNGLVGLIVVIMAIFIIRLIGTLFGYPDILDPAKLIENISL